MDINIDYDKLVEPDNMEKKLLIDVRKYIIQKGGGIYWAIFYWILYIAFAQEIIRRQANLDYAVFGIFIFFAIGFILSIGVYHHIKFLNRLKTKLQDWADDEETKINEKRKIYNDLVDNLKTDIRNLHSQKDNQKWPDAMNDLWDRVYKQVEK